MKYLELLMKGPFETPEDKKEANHASKIYPFLKKGNLMLCATLIVNTLCQTYISILFAQLIGDLGGFIASTVLKVLFSELIP